VDLLKRGLIFGGGWLVVFEIQEGFKADIDGMCVDWSRVVQGSTGIFWCILGF